MKTFISQTEAFRLINRYAIDRLLPTIQLPVPVAIGRTIAKAVVSRTSIPSFTNSARDGFILSKKGFDLALSKQPITVVGEIKAGDSLIRANKLEGDAAKIMTGAPVPDWGYTVAMLEDVTLINDTILVNDRVNCGAWIREIGSDVEAQFQILDIGRRLVPEHVQALISAGVTEVEVYDAPKVAICSTGDELVDINSRSLRSGQIYDSNRPFMESFVRSLDNDLVLSEHIEDTLGAMIAFLEAAMDSKAHLVMSSGAVSMGSYDFVKPALDAIGAEIIFHKVTQKPGKPLLFAVLPNNSLYFGLPGNPVSTVVNCRFYVARALSVMQSESIGSPLTLILANDIEKTKGITVFLKAQCIYEKNGSIVKTLEGQESFETSPLLTMNGWVMLPETSGSMRKGDLVEFFPAHPRGLPDIF